MCKICWLLKPLAILAVIISVANPFQALQAAAGATSAAEGKLSIVGNPVVTVSPSCNNDSGSAWIKIRNVGPAGSKPVSLHLTATAVSRKSPPGSVNAMVKAAVVAGPDSDQALTSQTLAPGNEAWIKLDVTGLSEPGDWETTLQNETVDVGPVKITRQELSFNLTLDVPNQDSPELTLEKGQPAHFGIKNNDNQDYTVIWEYDIDGWAARSGNPQRPRGCCLHEKDMAGVPSASMILVPAKGFKDVVFSPPCKWFRHSFVGLFKDQLGDGRLLLSRVDKGCSAAGKKDSDPTVKNADPTVVKTKTIIVKTHLAAGSASGREVLTDLIVFFFLLVGGFFSVVLNFMLPNHRRKLNLKAKLADLSGRITNLSNRLASRLRVLAGLECRLLDERLKQLTWTNPTFATDLENIEKGVTQLDARLQILESLGTTRDLFELRRAHNLRPSRIVAMEDTFEKIIAISKKSSLTDVEVEAAKALIASLSQELEATGKIDPNVISDLMERARQTQQDFVPTGIIGKTSTWKAISFQLCEANGVIDDVVARDTAKKTIPAENYLKLDRALFQLELAKSFVQKVDCLPDDNQQRKQILDHKEQLFALIASDNGQALYLASRMLLQVMEGKCKTQIDEALEKNNLRIVQDHVLPNPYEACEFKLEFLDPALDCATAREDWICQWTFTHPQEPALTEEGWEVTHYFQKPEAYGLKVRLTHRITGTFRAISDPRYQEKASTPPSVEKSDPIVPQSAETAPAGIQKTEESSPNHAMYIQIYETKVPFRTVLRSHLADSLNFFLALFVVLVGMIAGAKEQLLKLDVVPALIAIFLAGFGADQIKNLLTKQSESSTKSKTS